MKKLALVVLVLLLVGGAATAAALVAPASPWRLKSLASTDQKTDQKVCDAFRAKVLDTLRSPSTAKFQPCGDMGMLKESQWDIAYKKLQEANPTATVSPEQIASLDGALLTQHTGNYDVSGWVDAANAYGTPVRTTYFAHVRRSTDQYSRTGYDVEIWFSNP